MNPEEFLIQIRKQQMRFFPEARFIVLDELPFYLKIRIIISEEFFIEIRCNFKSLRQSYVLVENGDRIAGFDNLDSWHFHPARKPTVHQKINKPSLEEIFTKFYEILSKF